MNQNGLYDFHPDTGEPIDPPVIRSYEQQISDAQAQGDQALIDTISAEYADRRKEVAERHNERVEQMRTPQAGAATAPDESPEDLLRLTNEQLAGRINRAGLRVPDEGSGPNGRVVKRDLVAVLTGDDDDDE